MSTALELTIVRGDKPLHRQIADQIQTQIVSGLIAPGTRLPTVRLLAQQTGVCRVTALQAYEVLKTRGYARGIVGSGTFVQRPSERIGGERPKITPCGTQTDYGGKAKSQGTVNLATAEPDPELFDWKDFLATLLRNGPETGEERGLFGLGQLLTGLCGHYATLGLETHPDEITVTGGAVATNAVLMDVGCPQGTKVIVQTPAFPFAEDYFASFRIEPVGVPDKDGDIDLERFEEEAKAGGVSAAFLFPTCNQVTGESASLENKRRTIEIADKYGISVFEDVSAFWVRPNGPRPSFLSELSEGASVDVVSFDCIGKVLGQKVGIATVFAKGHIRQRIAVRSLGLGSAPSTLIQGCLANFIKSRSMGRHIARSVPRYLVRRQAMLAALQESMPKGCHWSKPSVGYVAELHLPSSQDADECAEQALRAGVSCFPSPVYCVGQYARNALRLAYSTAAVDDITVGVKRLGEILTRKIVQ